MTYGDRIALHFEAGRAAIIAILRRGVVTTADVNLLRRELFGDRCVSRDEAEALFALECTATEKCPEWTSFFVEAITDHMVWQTRPTGVVNTPQAEWLLENVDRAQSINALAALVNVLAEAHRAPIWLAAAARGRASAHWPGVDEALSAARLESPVAA